MGRRSDEYFGTRSPSLSASGWTRNRLPKYVGCPRPSESPYGRTTVLSGEVVE